MKKWIIGILSVVGCAIVLMIMPFFITLDYYKPLISKVVYNHTGRQLTIRGHINIVIFPIPEMIIHDAALANPPGFHDADILTVPEIDIIFKELPLFKEIIEVKEIDVKNPVLSLEKKEDGAINWQLAKQQITQPSSDQHHTEKSSQKSYGFSLKKLVIDKGELHYLENNHLTVLSGIKTAMLLSEKDGSLGIVSGFQSGGRFMNVVMNITNIQRLINDHSSPIYFSLSDIGNKLAVSCNITLHDQQVDLTQMQLVLNKNQLSGAVQVDYAAHPLAVKADLHGDRLNMDEVENINTGSSAPDHTGPATPMPAPAVAQEGWSTAPISVQFLNQVQAELHYTGPIELPHAMIDDAEFDATIHDGQLDLQLKKLNLESGSANGVLHIQSVNQSVEMQTSFVFDHVHLGKLLGGNMQGVASGTAVVKMKGNNMKDLVGSLAGNAKVAIEHADIKAINGNRLDTLVGGNDHAAEMLKSLHDKLIFDSITATAVITNGIISNQDLKATSPSIVMTGKGEINLPEKTISYQLFPESDLLSAMTQGDVKVNVNGLLSHPVIKVDAQMLLNKYLSLTPQALSQLKKDTKPLKDKLVKNLRHLFGSSE